MKIIRAIPDGKKYKSITPKDDTDIFKRYPGRHFTTAIKRINPVFTNNDCLSIRNIMIKDHLDFEQAIKKYLPKKYPLRYPKKNSS